MRSWGHGVNCIYVFGEVSFYFLLMGVRQLMVLLYFVHSNRKKRMREIQKKMKSGTINLREDDPLEMFVSSTDIRYCYYSETHKILGNTYGMCILQVST